MTRYKILGGVWTGRRYVAVVRQESGLPLSRGVSRQRNRGNGRIIREFACQKAWKPFPLEESPMVSDRSIMR